MDALSHAVVGAAIGELSLGKKQGNRAVWLGAAAAVVPDIDLITKPLLGDLAFLVTHRGVTHSLVFAILGALALAWITMRVLPLQADTSFKDWRKLYFWAIISHILLDCATAFGTQVFYPLTYRVSFGIISVVDPLFTGPLLILVAFIFWHRNRTRTWSRNFGYFAILWGMLYLTLAFTNKMVVSTIASNSYHRFGKSVYHVHVFPALGNNFIWCTIAEEPYGFDVAYFSLLDASRGIQQYYFLPKDENLPEGALGQPPYEQLDWVCNGLFATKVKGDTLLWYDLRYGLVDPRPEAWGKTPYTLTYQITDWQSAQPEVDMQFSGIGPFVRETLPAYRAYW